MHELSICTSLARMVEAHAEGRPVTTVHLDVGHLRQVVPATLHFTWGVVVAGTPLEGSVLAINEIPATIVCRECAVRTTLSVPVFRCPCGSTTVEVVAGEELLVRSLDLVSTRPPERSS